MPCKLLKDAIMKKVILLAGLLFFGVACSKNDDNGGTSNGKEGGKRQTGSFSKPRTLSKPKPRTNSLSSSLGGRSCIS